MDAIGIAFGAPNLEAHLFEGQHIVPRRHVRHAVPAVDIRHRRGVGATIKAVRIDRDPGQRLSVGICDSADEGTRFDLGDERGHDRK
jgi:hypothetical protein